MAISVLDLFTIGIGPSSSHTVGPMRAAGRFVDLLSRRGLLDRVARVRAHLYGSLAATGRGHATDTAVLLGLEAQTPEEVDLALIPARLDRIRRQGSLCLGGKRDIRFDEPRDLQWHAEQSLPAHPNGMRFVASGSADQTLCEAVYYSVGGGFGLGEAEANGGDALPESAAASPSGGLPFGYRSGEDMLRMAHESGLSVSEMTLRNECVFRPETETCRRLLRVWRAMADCVERGCRTEGTLPGRLGVTRRAPRLHRDLTERPEINLRDPLAILDWVSMWAMAVNEENAAGGRVVTAPTNGAAGILPAVLHYLARIRGAGDDQIVRFLLTAGAIGILYKLNASISGAEVGCQGEVGVACSMAAGALAEALGGTVPQVENAAEIGMEHNLGLTCDPIGGLVQVPCIERNAMGAIKAINAARLALAGDGTHRVSLDRVMATMRQTGADMSSKYKETARGGLAVNVIEC